MGNIKSQYTLAEAAEYLKRETGTPDISARDIVTLAAEGKLFVCFPYKGPLGLFKNEHVTTPIASEVSRVIFQRALKIFYFRGILRSLSQPALDEEISDLQGNSRKANTLHPVRVVPVCVFGSAPPVELGEPEGYHWRRVHGSKSSWDGTLLTAAIPEADWKIEAQSLYALAAPFQSAGSTESLCSQRQQERLNPSEPLQEETSEQRQNRRLAWLHESGGYMEKKGMGWETQGPVGLLAQLAKEEKAAGRPMSDKSDVRRGLISATERMRDGKTLSTMMGEHFPEDSPEHPRSALEKVWGSRRGS